MSVAAGAHGASPGPDFLLQACSAHCGNGLDHQAEVSIVDETNEEVLDLAAGQDREVGQAVVALAPQDVVAVVEAVEHSPAMATNDRGSTESLLDHAGSMPNLLW